MEVARGAVLSDSAEASFDTATFIAGTIFGGDPIIPGPFLRRKIRICCAGYQAAVDFFGLGRRGKGVRCPIEIVSCNRCFRRDLPGEFDNAALFGLG